jgi:hypothetical protein
MFALKSKKQANSPLGVTLQMEMMPKVLRSAFELTHRLVGL